MLSQLAALPDALLALWLMLLGEGVLEHDRRLVRVAAIGLGVSAAATWFLRTVSTRVQRRFRDKVTIALESHVARLQASIATIAHQERPEYLDRLSMLRNQVFVLDHMYMSLFSTLRLDPAAGRDDGAAGVDSPGARAARGVRAADRADVDVAAGGRAQRRRSAARSPTGWRATCSRIATTAPPGKEVRVTGIGERLVERAPRGVGALVRTGGRARAGARRAGTRWRGRSSARAYVGAVVFVSSGLSAPAGDVLLVLAAGARLSAYIGATVGEIGFLRGILDGRLAAARLARGLRRRRSPRTGDLPVPAALRRGIRLRPRVVRLSRHVARRARRCVADAARRARSSRSSARTAPARRRWSSCWRRCTSRRRARSSSTTRRSRACRPTSGARGWRARSRISSASSSAPGTPSAWATCRAWTTSPRWSPAVDRAGADDVVARLTSGLDTQLGPTWPGGVELSFGQWQKLALARGFMRDQPLLLVLDEPTAALDAETEHALFERYAAARARSSASGGRITILVSHRFSTVRMADLIVVLDGARSSKSARTTS